MEDYALFLWKSFHKCSFAVLLRQISFCISVGYAKNTLSHTTLFFLAGEQDFYFEITSGQYEDLSGE